MPMLCEKLINCNEALHFDLDWVFGYSVMDLQNVIFFSFFFFMFLFSPADF